MTDRRTEILDTALTVLADTGMRGLTHRAVDTAAGLAQGSTSYYFRTRDALITACVRRLLDLDVTELPATVPTTLDEIADLAAASVVRLALVDAGRTRARYELSLHAVRVPDVHAELVTAGDELRRLITGLVARTGVADPEQTAHALAALLEGLTFTGLIRGPHTPDALFTYAREPIFRLLSAFMKNNS